MWEGDKKCLKMCLRDTWMAPLRRGFVYCSMPCSKSRIAEQPLIELDDEDAEENETNNEIIATLNKSETPSSSAASKKGDDADIESTTTTTNEGELA